MDRKTQPRRCALTFVAVLGIVGLIASPSAATLIIDDFSHTTGDAPLVVVLDTVAATTVDQGGLAGVLGGDRELRLIAQALELPLVDYVQARIIPAAGVFDYASSVGADGRTTLAYFGSGGLNANLTGDQFLQIDFTHFDFAGNAPMNVSVTLGDGTHSAGLVRQLTAPGAQSLVFDFASFSGIGALDRAHVQLIEVAFEPAAAADFRLAEIRTDVPEPAGLAILAAGAVALARRRHGCRG